MEKQSLSSILDGKETDYRNIFFVFFFIDNFFFSSDFMTRKENKVTFQVSLLKESISYQISKDHLNYWLIVSQTSVLICMLFDFTVTTLYQTYIFIFNQSVYPLNKLSAILHSLNVKTKIFLSLAILRSYIEKRL